MKVRGTRAVSKPEDNHERLVERWVEAIPGSEAILREVCHASYVEHWPQSNEHFGSLDELISVHRSYPGGIPDQKADIKVRGAKEQWVVTTYFAQDYQPPEWRTARRSG